MIKVDLTRASNPDHERLLEQYGVKGVPTIVFLDVTGKERENLRLMDYLPPKQFPGRMAALKTNENLDRERMTTMVKVQFFLNEPNGKP
jgi:thiol:disulfide interchange protein DsbD